MSLDYRVLATILFSDSANYRAERARCGKIGYLIEFEKSCKWKAVFVGDHILVEILRILQDHKNLLICPTLETKPMVLQLYYC